MKTWIRSTFGLGMGIALLASPVHAVHSHGPDSLVGSGSQSRAYRNITVDVAREREGAWQRFTATSAGTWRVRWDSATGVAAEIWGSGLPTPGSSRSTAIAERAARRWFDANAGLVAPGLSASDFRVSSDVSGGIVTIVMQQMVGGVALETSEGAASVVFRFKHDRLIAITSTAIPEAVGVEPAPLSAALLRAGVRAAESWLTTAIGAAGFSTVVQPASTVFALLGSSSRAPEPAISVTLQTASPVGKWTVWLRARDLTPLFAQQNLRFASAPVFVNTAVRWPGGEQQDYPARSMSLGDGWNTDASGIATWNDEDGPRSATLRPTGPRIEVINNPGALASLPATITNGVDSRWSAESRTESEDAQISAFVHAEEARRFAQWFAPELKYLNGPIYTTVNIDDTCNAYSDGASINFFVSSEWCENTGRLADVVYHEFGHSLHYQSLVPAAGLFNSELSEGISDFLAASMTGDPAMGIGFFYNSQPLRHVAPEGELRMWPRDISHDSHETGLIIAGALWDLRSAFIAQYGEAGLLPLHQMFYEALRRTKDIPGMYLELLVADDDDGDLDNGTPNICLIADAFGAHGLRARTVQTETTRTAETLALRVELRDWIPQCPSETVVAASVAYGPPGDAQTTIAMTIEPNQLVAQIPLIDQSEKLTYRVTIETAADGPPTLLPDNPADPLYEATLEAGETLYFTDFETDPAKDGWTTELLSGSKSKEGSNDWQWGRPQSEPNAGDPARAYSGKRVYGNDLGEDEFNGAYQPEVSNVAWMPTLTVPPGARVRLQYRRWLNVEDGFFDQAQIIANDEVAWTNLNSDQGDASNVAHRDAEWRFHDVDLTPFVKDGALRVGFRLTSDAGLEMGGWTLDDVRVVTFGGGAPVTPSSVCGDGVLDADETCDPGAEPSCAADCSGLSPAADADGELEFQPANGCACSVPTRSGADRPTMFSAALVLAALLRRRRHGQ